MASYYNSQGHSEEIKSLFNQNLDHSKQFIGKTISAILIGLLSLITIIFSSKIEFIYKTMEDDWINLANDD